MEITLIYSGSHKVDGNPYSHLPDDVRETLQSRMDATRQMFAQKVSAYTGLSVQAVLDTEAAVYSGQEAIDAGLADELVNSTDAITVMRDALDARKSRLSGGRMTKETQSTTVSATASQADITTVEPARGRKRQRGAAGCERRSPQRLRQKTALWGSSSERLTDAKNRRFTPE
ncbi:hypothetical protein ECZU29_00140 [Escherichia coli]|nr:hypothetical protein ECZU29_00140 [Escherichia coli]